MTTGTAPKQIVTCKFCKSTNIIKMGFTRVRSGLKQRYQCKECCRVFRVEGD